MNADGTSTPIRTRVRKRPGRLVTALYRFRTEHNTPLRQALAVGLGLFIGATPFIGFHLLLALGLGWLFRLNRFKVYLAANISNPFVAPLLYAAEIQVGAWLRTGHVYSAATLDQVHLRGLTADIMIGSVVVGTVLATTGSALTYWAVGGRGDDAQVAALVDAAAEPYLTAGISTWEFARGKLRMDPVYLQVLKAGVLPNQGLLFDLGCGQGLMLALLVAARDRLRAGQWPHGWPPPPAALDLRGIELRPRVARRAAEVLGESAAIETVDLAHSSLPPCQAVLLFDVLHLMSRDAQNRLLDGVSSALTPGGVLVIREANASEGWRFTMVQMGNRLNAILQGKASRAFQFDTEPGWRVRLEGRGFIVEKIAHNPGGPFANFLIAARRG